MSGFGDIVCPLARPLCFSAVYAEAGKLFFQFGWRRWNLDSDDLDIKHYHLSNKCFSRFEIRQSGRKVLAFTYPHVLRTLYANLDPTYDQIDHDADFFLAFLADHAKDAEWRTNAMKMWDESRRGR